MVFELTFKQDPPKIFDADATVKEFLNLYYTVSGNELINLTRLFNPDAKCAVNNFEIIGFQNIAISFLQKNISKIIYQNVNCIYQIVDPHTLLVQNSGRCKFSQTFELYQPYLHLQGNISYNFTETFVLVLNNNNVSITNWIFKYF